MVTDGNDDENPTVFDRDHVLFGPLREQVLDLEQVHRYGAQVFDDADAISLYGMTPREWYGRGIRMLGRTTVECTRDRLAAMIGADVADLARAANEPVTLVVDPFAGSGNTLYWLHRALPHAAAVGVELDPVICAHTRHNLELVGCPVEVHNAHYADALTSLDTPNSGVVVVFVGPPWGHALDLERGLDLDATAPPVSEIVDRVVDRFGGRTLLIAVQAYERIEPASLDRLESVFDWSRLHTYALNPPGRNPATLLGTLGWAPGGSTDR